jgi:hypothetical protein
MATGSMSSCSLMSHPARSKRARMTYSVHRCQASGPHQVEAVAWLARRLQELAQDAGDGGGEATSSIGM